MGEEATYSCDCTVDSDKPCPYCGHAGRETTRTPEEVVRVVYAQRHGFPTWDDVRPQVLVAIIEADAEAVCERLRQHGFLTPPARPTSPDTTP